MIRISLGNVGSGKTVSEVREMLNNRTNRLTFSNILMKIPQLTPKIRTLNSSMIINRVLVDYKVNKKSGENVPIYQLKVNKEFWQNIHEPINIVLDEAHTIINARRAMSNVNVIVTDWMALIRRVLGVAESGMGELVFITQLPNRIDPIAREMATQIRYHICHFIKECKICNSWWNESSEEVEPCWICKNCGSPEIIKKNYEVQVWHFRNMDCYFQWKMLKQKTYHANYIIHDIEDYFKYYDTFQWENLFSEYYT